LNKLAKYKLCGDIDATITGKLLYLILDELADGNGEVVIPQRKISDALHISKGAVSRNLRRLRDGGYGDRIHSMSMSDIVVISRDGHSTANYVDAYGFTPIPQFLEPETIRGARKEVVSGYTVAVRIPVGNSNTVFVLAENPGAPSPFVTWHGHKTIKGYEWGHYFDRRADAVKDLYNGA